PPGRKGAADYVLEDFNASEQQELPFIIEKAIQAAFDVINLGITEAMNRHNTPADN
ncbi:MAG: aminoacyl-tRNA hydrolase, partial [Anaerolineales bacterium]